MRIIVTQAKFDELFSIDDWFRFAEMTNRELYEKLLLFVTDDEGEPLTIDQARAEFRKIPRKQWPDYVSDFYRSVSDAFVNPTSAGG